MRKVESDLSFLPKSFADNPQGHLLNLCSAFIQQVDIYTSGKANPNPDDRTFLREGRPHYLSLQGEIGRTRPPFAIAQENQVTVAAPPGEVLHNEKDKSKGIFHYDIANSRDHT